MPTDEAHENTLTVEQLAAESGMSVRNIRAHQARGLLPPPEVRQRVGYYGPGHVTRLQLISQLQADGFNLKGIERLLEGASGEASESIMSFRRAVTEPFESEQTSDLHHVGASRALRRRCHAAPPSPGDQARTSSRRWAPPRSRSQARDCSRSLPR